MHKALFFTAAGLFSGCAGSAQPRTSPAPAARFTLDDAVSILGEPAELTDSSTTHSQGAFRYQCAFKTAENTESTDKPGAIYYLFEEYDQMDAAGAKYSSILTANAGHDGVKVLSGLGDEAYFHSDGENFLFLMARKGTRVLTMKVNKITRTTSRDAFDDVARSIVAGF